MSYYNKDKTYDVIVVGAGASGLIAAGRAAELGAKVLLIEKMKKAGRKLLITGKGRCNISNAASTSEYFKNTFPNGRYLKHAFSKFFADDIVKLLNDNGVPTTIERGNRIFPTSNKSEDVLNALMKWIKKYSVEFLYQTKVEEILFENNKAKGVLIQQNDKIIEILGKNVIICTGGKSYPATGSTGDGYNMAQKLGHNIEEPRPALVPLVTSGNLAEKLQGLSLKNVKAVLWINGKKSGEEFGEMLFAHFGLTGPIILSMSRNVVNELRDNKKVKISIDLKPALDENKLDTRLLRDLNTNGKKQIENIMKLWMPSKLISVLLDKLGIDGKKQGHQIKAKERRKLMLTLKNLDFDVIDYRGFKEAIITAGGISTQEIDGKSMESKLVKNLYFAGEVIDLDANTGGYNLQIAYSTAWLAAESCLKNKTEI